MQTFLNKKNSTHRFNIRNVINIWKRTKYYPVLNVKRNYKNSSMEISYVKSINIFDNKTEDWIPVTYTTQSQLDFQNTNVFWLNSISQSYKIVNISNNDWVIFNIQQVGKYNAPLSFLSLILYYFRYKYFNFVLIFKYYSNMIICTLLVKCFWTKNIGKCTLKSYVTQPKKCRNTFINTCFAVKESHSSCCLSTFRENFFSCCNVEDVSFYKNFKEQSNVSSFF